jgi:ribbon-helix-helix CopG family protein
VISSPYIINEAAMRTLVDIPNDELEALNALSKAEGVSRAESIRRAISAYVELNRPPVRHEGFGLWKDKGIDTDEYLRKIRAEWDRDSDFT